MNYGVAGSAYGTVLAQFSSLLLILLYRKMGKASLKIDFSGMKDFIPRTKEIFSLGAPGALGNLGVSLTAIITLYNLQEWGVSENYDLAVGAFGVITRVTIFTFMPLLGFNIAFQTIVGTNYGAGLKTRVNEILKFALTLSLGYCILIQAYFFWDADNLGLYFLADDPDLASETSRIITIITLLFFSFGPTSIIASYFQAIGDAKRAAILNIARTYFFAIPLIYIMPQIFDKLGLIAEPAIWYARPIAEIGMIILTFITLRHNARKNGLRYGILSN